MQGGVDGVSQRVLGPRCFGMEVDEEPCCEGGCQTEKEKVTPESIVARWFSSDLGHQRGNIFGGRRWWSWISKKCVSIGFVWECRRVHSRPSIWISWWLSKLLYRRGVLWSIVQITAYSVFEPDIDQSVSASTTSRTSPIIGVSFYLSRHPVYGLASGFSRMMIASPRTPDSSSSSKSSTISAASIIARIPTSARIVFNF